MKTKPIATWYQTDGHTKEITPAKGKTFNLKEMQEYVGGTIDIQFLPKDKQYMILNDNGKLDGLPENLVGTAIWKKNYPILEYPLNTLN